MLILVSVAVGAVVGAVAGVIIARVMNLPAALTIGAAVVIAAVGGGGGYFLAQNDFVPAQEFAAAREAAEALPDVKVLKQYFPADYAALQNQMEVVKGDRLGVAGVNQMVRATANAVMQREARKANDANLVRLMQLRRDKAEALRQKNVAWCYDFTRNARLTFDPNAVVPPEMVQRERDITSDILRQVATDPVLNAPGAAGANSNTEDRSLKAQQLRYGQVEIRDNVAKRARAGFSEDEQKTIVMLSGRSVSLDEAPRQGLMCRYSIAQLDETLQLPPEQAAMVYRLNLGKGL
ncbi:MAG: hypothetical protein GC145_17285 [Caulobacter sp.]|nr:hypothetical protein [Caulobacter sp.]